MLRAWGLVLTALLLVAPTVGAAGERAYVAQSLWSAKHLAGLDDAWLKNRPIWMEKPTGDAVVVGIVSTGVDPDHPDLDGVVAGFRDFVGDAAGARHAEAYDDHGFGTYVAGVVAGSGSFQWNPLRPYWIVGARGVAPEATVLVAKAVERDESSTDRAVAEAILWLADPDGDGRAGDGADVILLPISVERPRLTPNLATPLEVGTRTREAALHALALGIPLVVSVGDDPDAKPRPPADVPAAIVVGALDRIGGRVDFGSEGPSLDVLAPGVIVGPWPKALDTWDFAQDGYASVAGTGVAAAFTAGLVALLVSADPGLGEPTLGEETARRKVAYVEKALKDNAATLGLRPEQQGAGALQAQAALAAADRGGAKLDVVVVGLAAALLALLAGLGARTAFRAAAKRPKKAEDE